jgi:hypothetical protein
VVQGDHDVLVRAVGVDVGDGDGGLAVGALGEPATAGGDDPGAGDVAVLGGGGVAAA